MIILKLSLSLLFQIINIIADQQFSSDLTAILQQFGSDLSDFRLNNWRFVT